MNNNNILKTIGLTILSILLFTIMFFTLNVIYFLILYLVVKIPYMINILKIDYFNLLTNYIIQPIIFAYTFKSTIRIINKISNDYRIIYHKNLAIILTIIFGFFGIINLISLFLGTFDLRITVLDAIFMIYSIIQITESKEIIKSEKE